MEMSLLTLSSFFKEWMTGFDTMEAKDEFPYDNAVIPCQTINWSVVNGIDYL